MIKKIKITEKVEKDLNCSVLLEDTIIQKIRSKNFFQQLDQIEKYNKANITKNKVELQKMIYRYKLIKKEDNKYKNLNIFGKLKANTEGEKYYKVLVSLIKRDVKDKKQQKQLLLALEDYSIINILIDDKKLTIAEIFSGNKYQSLLSAFKTSIEYKNELTEHLELKQNNIYKTENIVNGLIKFENFYKLMEKQIKKREDEEIIREGVKTFKEKEQILSNLVEDVLSISEIDNQLENYNFFLENFGGSKLHFNPEEFGPLKMEYFADNDELTTFNLNNNEKDKINFNKRGMSFTEKIIEFSKHNDHNGVDFTAQNEETHNFVSNLLHSLLYDKIQDLDVIQRKTLFNDLKELITSYIYLFNATEKAIGQKLISFLFFDVLLSSEFIQLRKSSAFSKNGLISKEKAEQIRNKVKENKNKLKITSLTNDFENGITEIQRKNLSFESHFYKENNKEHNIKDKKYNPSFDISTQRLISKTKKSDIFNIIPKVFLLWTKIIINYEQYIENGNYHRPNFLFNKKIDILEMISKFKEALKTGDILNFFDYYSYRFDDITVNYLKYQDNESDENVVEEFKYHSLDEDSTKETIKKLKKENEKEEIENLTQEIGVGLDFDEFF